MNRARFASYLFKTLVGLELFVGISAVFGGIGLITTNGLTMPFSFLEHSPFHSFVGPGIILAGIIGGTNILAAAFLLKKKRFALEASAVAGFGLLIWIFVQLYMIRQGHWLHSLYFGCGILILVLTMLLLRLTSGEKR